MKDLSGDGKITKKDVLIGRGVLPKNAKNGGLTAGIKNIKGLKDGTKGSDKIIVKDGKSEKQLLKEAGERGRNYAKRFTQTLDTRKNDTVRDAKTGKEMSMRQFNNLRKKQRIESNRKNYPSLTPGMNKKQNIFGKQVEQREDKSVFDYQTKDKPVKKVVGKIKRAMGMSGLKNGGQVKARGQGAATRGFNFKVN